jgi:hypothetical protein
MEEYLTPDELLARWRNVISPWTLKNWRYQGKGPDFAKIGGKVFYPVKAVEEYEKKQVRKPGKK